MDVMTIKVKLMKAMYDEVCNMKNEYIHRYIPIEEEHPFNIEYHIGRYHAYRELLEEIDKIVADRIDEECMPTINVMHEYIDKFTSNLHITNNS